MTVSENDLSGIVIRWISRVVCCGQPVEVRRQRGKPTLAAGSIGGRRLHRVAHGHEPLLEVNSHVRRYVDGGDAVLGGAYPVRERSGSSYRGPSLDTPSADGDFAV